MSARQPQVFISYQRADESLARQMREHLAAHGVQTWMDQYDIPVGAYWPDEIDKGLAGSDVVVGILSPDSVESRNVKNEWDWAIAHDRRLVLLMARPTNIPHRYISINFIDAAASNQVSAFATLLRSLGVEPVSPDSVTTVTSEREPPAPTRHTTSRSRRRRQQPLTVGRQREQEMLARQLDELLAGNGSIVLVGGEAGIGKTTLTAWLAWAAEQRDAVVCVGGCYDLTTTPPYGPWVEIIRAWPADEHGLPQAPPELRGDAMARVHSQAALFEIAADFFTAASAVKPLVLLLEDLHWTDQASLDLLRYLARSVAHQRLMLVATYRDDELTRRHPLQQLLPSLIREANAQRLALQRLGNAALSALIASRYPLAAADLERLTDHIEQLTEGNPFFATEALRALEDAGTLVLEDGDWRVSELDQVRVPDLVRQVITGRLERLGDDARHLLQIAAVIGHEVDIDLWVEISDTDESRLVDVLERAIEARLVEELRDSSRLRFTHALVREALYTDLISVRQRSWHRQIGEALANRSQPDPDIIATHFQRAADPRAAQWMIRGGERAQRAYAWSTAVERYEAALELLLVADSDPRERGWLQYRIARLRRFQDPRESLDLLDEALRIAAELNDRALAAASRFSVGVCRFFLGDYPAAIAGMTAGADLLEALPLEEQERLDLEPNQQGVPTITNARGFLVAAMANVGYLAEALRMGETTQEAVPKATPLAELGWSHYGDRHGALGMVYALLGRVDEARDSFVRARDMYRENGHFSTQAVAAFHQLQFITLPYRTEHMSEHTQLVAEAEAAEARAAAIVAFDTGPSTVSFPLLYLDGRWDVAAANARATLESDAVSLFDHDICHVTLARVAQARGERDAGWRHVRALLPAETATEPGTVPLHDALLLQRAAIELALDAGDLDLAETWLATQARWLEWSGVVPGRAEYQVLLARYHQLAGDVDAALAAADAAITHASDPRQPLALAMAYRTRGDLAIDQNQLDDAVNDLQVSLRLTESCAAPYERALTLTALARLAIAAGNNPAEMLAEARTICQRLEARPALERVIGIEQQVAGG